jgi:hypothetical protein
MPSKVFVLEVSGKEMTVLRYDRDNDLTMMFGWNTITPFVIADHVYIGIDGHTAWGCGNYFRTREEAEKYWHKHCLNWRDKP